MCTSHFGAVVWGSQPWQTTELGGKIKWENLWCKLTFGVIRFYKAVVGDGIQLHNPTDLSRSFFSRISSRFFVVDFDKSRVSSSYLRKKN